MGLKRTDEFRKDAVRTALTSGLTRKQVADDLGFGMSTLNRLRIDAAAWDGGPCRPIWSRMIWHAAIW
jgi:transposase-like protein